MEELTNHKSEVDPGKVFEGHAYALALKLKKLKEAKDNLRRNELLSEISEYALSKKTNSIGSYKPQTPTLQNKPEPIPPTVTLGGIRIASRGNMSAIIANPGAGKSSICSAIIAKRINPECDGLGIQVYTDRLVAYVDTEQSWDDHYTLWGMNRHRAGLSEDEEMDHTKAKFYWMGDCENYTII